ncbi:type IV pilus biogenesis and competence protein PilQ precursor [bacterium BMS3Bbin05]|nr:type IV pilus biogenesis and competence protein PilQ precursor [bacterium BMS3Bbin05]
MNKKNLFSILLMPLILILYSCATTGNVATVPKSDVNVSERPVIESIDVFDNQIRVKVSKPFEYTIYKPGDPFTAVVELPGVDAGSFQEKIIPNREGITEINPVTVSEPTPSTELKVLLQRPSNLVPEKNGNLLILNVEKEEEAPVPAEEVAGNETVAGEEVPVENIEDQNKPVDAGEAVETPLEEAVESKGVPAITGIEFERVKDGVKVVIVGDSPIKPDVLPLENRIVLDFKGVEMKAETPKEVAYPLKGIRWGKHNGKTRIVLDLMGEATYNVAAINNTVVVSLSGPGLVRPIAGGEAGSKMEAQEKEKALPQKKDEALAFAEGKYRGKRISLDFQDADIIPIFRLFSDVSGYNFVISPKVKGKITMKLVNVPWDQALDLVLRTNNLGQQMEGNIIRIAPNKDLAKESEAKAKARAAMVNAKPLATKIFNINYAGVDRIKEVINKSKLLSSRGSLTTDERASVIIVNDVDDTFPKVQSLIDKIDRPELQVRQVLIEARIVEVNTNYVRDLGIQWGASGNTTDFQLSAGGTGQVGGPGFTGNNFIVNMPAAIQQGSGAAIGIGYLNAARTLALDLQLSALERTGKGKVVSNPRIITMNNTAAKITHGKTIYVPVATSDKTDVKAIDANLTLDVTPSIAPGGAILLKLKVSKDEPGDIVAGNISINRNNVETTTLINSGDTVVIGGIYKKSNITSDDGVPWLSKIPILGLLFKHKSVSENTSEILIFITPKVIKYELPKKEKDSM